MAVRPKRGDSKIMKIFAPSLSAAFASKVAEWLGTHLAISEEREFASFAALPRRAIEVRPGTLATIA
jgi:hypothetical protein